MYAGQLGRDGVHLGLRQVVALGQRFGVRAAGEGAHFVEERVEILALVLNLLVVPGDGGDRRADCR